MCKPGPIPELPKYLSEIFFQIYFGHLMPHSTYPDLAVCLDTSIADKFEAVPHNLNEDVLTSEVRSFFSEVVICVDQSTWHEINKRIIDGSGSIWKWQLENGGYKVLNFKFFCLTIKCCSFIFRSFDQLKSQQVISGLPWWFRKLAISMSSPQNLWDRLFTNKGCWRH
jgi:hypothetical protein